MPNRLGRSDEPQTQAHTHNLANLSIVPFRDNKTTVVIIPRRGFQSLLISKKYILGLNNFVMHAVHVSVMQYDVCEETAMYFPNRPFIRHIDFRAVCVIIRVKAMWRKTITIRYFQSNSNNVFQHQSRRLSTIGIAYTVQAQRYLYIFIQTKFKIVEHIIIFIIIIVNQVLIS